MPLEHPVKMEVTIGTHKQRIVYEGDDIMCTGYRFLGHTTVKCPIRKATTNAPFKEPMAPTDHHDEDTWEIVRFPKCIARRKAQGPNIYGTNQSLQYKHPKGVDPDQHEEPAEPSYSRKADMPGGLPKSTMTEKPYNQEKWSTRVLDPTHPNKSLNNHPPLSPLVSNDHQLTTSIKAINEPSQRSGRTNPARIQNEFGKAKSSYIQDLSSLVGPLHHQENTNHEAIPEVSSHHHL